MNVRELCQKLLQSPRGQFNIYLSRLMPASQQRELVSYRGGKTRGSIRRLQDGVPAQQIDASQLEPLLVADLLRYDDCFYTFMSAPVFGLTVASENREYRHVHEQLFPTPIHMAFFMPETSSS